MRYWFIQRKCLNKSREGINMSSKWITSLFKSVVLTA
ncbi:thiol:disulfide interchange protein, partial [Salmonella enterica subsp. enterica serovar Kentucky]|nr:thiol:disulfide interchange protein [Salmonella enterica subsp. enterica serovar Kentucky]MDK86408.1 thiol:disulfide interchange protein [Salmonella enterica subsp. enterica serovar Schwarzengrund]